MFELIFLKILLQLSIFSLQLNPLGQFPNSQKECTHFLSRTNPSNFDKFPYDLMNVYNFHLMPLMVVGIISGRLVFKFKSEVKETIKSMFE